MNNDTIKERNVLDDIREQMRLMRKSTYRPPPQHILTSIGPDGQRHKDKRTFWCLPCQQWERLT